MVGDIDRATRFTALAHAAGIGAMGGYQGTVIELDVSQKPFVALDQSALY